MTAPTSVLYVLFNSVLGPLHALEPARFAAMNSDQGVLQVEDRIDQVVEPRLSRAVTVLAHLPRSSEINTHPRQLLHIFRISTLSSDVLTRHREQIQQAKQLRPRVFAPKKVEQIEAELLMEISLDLRPVPINRVDQVRARASPTGS